MTEGQNPELGALFNAPDAGNQGPGDTLRRAREAQRISIDSLAAHIKVSVAKLEALEAGRFADLPDANFARALAMTLCRVLKVDPASVLAGLPAARLATLVSDTPPLNQPFKASRASMHLFDRSWDWSAFLKPQWLAPAALLLAAVLLYSVPGSSDWPARIASWFHVASAPATGDAVSAADASASAAAGEGEPVPTGLPQEVTAVPSLQPAVAPVKPAASEVAVAEGSSSPLLKLDSSEAPVATPATATTTTTNQAAPVVEPVTSPATTAAPAAPVSNSMLSVRAQQATWIEIKDARGNRLLGRLVQRDEVVDMSVPPPLTLRIGNASGMTLSFKGQVVDLVPYTRNNVARLELK
jgi:cytoskeleton protein RodZ